MTVEDRALARQLLAGDEVAFAGVVERYHGPLLRLALVFVADREAAEEVVQDAWLGVLNGLRSFDGRSSLKTWIFRMLTKKAETRGDQRDRPRNRAASGALKDSQRVRSVHSGGIGRDGRPRLPASNWRSTEPSAAREVL